MANCGKLPGGVVLAPDAHLDDGWLELVIIDTKGGLVGWADLVRRMGLAGIGVTNDGLPSTGRIEMRKTRHASVVTDSPARVQVDGDVLGYATTVRSRVVPGGTSRPLLILAVLSATCRVAEHPVAGRDKVLICSAWA